MALVGCGGGGNGAGGESAGATQVSPQRLLAAAPEKAAAAGSSRVSFTITVDSPQVEDPIEMSGEGEFDYADREGTLSFDLSEVFAAAGQENLGEEPVELIVEGDVYYMKYPLLSGLLGAQKPWIKVDLGTLSEQQGIDLSSLQQLNQGDPSQTLAYLEAAGRAQRLGSEEVGEVETTHYRARIDLTRVAELAPPESREAVREAVRLLRDQTGLDELPIEVWIDADGRPRRLSYEFDATVQGQTIETSLEMEFSDYGLDVSVEPPPASEVTDLSKLTE